MIGADNTSAGGRSHPGRNLEPINLAAEAPIRLGALTITPALRQVVHDDVREQIIEPRVMQVLVALLRADGQILTRDDLLASCWHGVIVGEDALTRVIGGVRRLSEGIGVDAFKLETITKVGYRIVTPRSATESEPSRAPIATADSGPLLAVLAFDNLCEADDMTWFSDGVSEEVLHTVARGSGLRVIGRGSSFQFRGADKAADRVAAALKVTHVLDGAVRRSGNWVRVSAQLVECGGQTTLWSARFDRDMADMFALQDEIAAAVAEALKAAFSRAGPSPGKVDPAAYDLFLRARDTYRPPAERVPELEQCVALAPDFALGWAWLAHGRAGLATFDLGDLERGPVLEAARKALATAERLDPTMGFTRTVRQFLEPPAAWRRREALLSEALRLTPSDVPSLDAMSKLAGSLGRCRESLALAEQAKLLDPLSPQTVARWVNMLDERYDERMAAYDAARARWPAFPEFSFTAATSAALSTDWQRYEALRSHAYAQPFAKDRGYASRMNGTFRFFDAVRDHDQAFLDDFASSLLSRVERTGAVPLNMLWLAGSAGCVDAAFQAIERAAFDSAFEVGGYGTLSRWWPGTLFLRCFCAALIDDPRFLRLCAKLGLVHYWLETNRWPDCADQVPYDFRAEARRVAEEGLARHV